MRKTYKDLVKGDVVILTNGNGLYTGLNHLTEGREYVIQETPVQERWPMDSGGYFFPELKLPVLSDQGKLVKPKASRFKIKEVIDA